MPAPALNADRTIVRIIRAAAAAHGVEVQSIGEGWVLRLTRGHQTRFLHGYTLDLNTAATHTIACDKAGTSDVLAAAAIPRVEHRLFLHPKMAAFVAHKGNWEAMLALAHAHQFDIVAKDNHGTGGRGVYRVRNALDLETAVYRLFDQTHAVALSPYHEARHEHRFVMLDGRCEVAYTKLRPSVTGDGRRTVLELLSDQLTREGPAARLIANMDDDAAAGLGDVVPAGHVRLLNWRHNLGQGASVRLLDLAAAENQPLLTLARAAASAMNLRYGSVDLIETARGPLIMEVNAGLMMEFLAHEVPEGESIAQRIYQQAFGLMWQL